MTRELGMLIPYGRQNISEEDISAVLEVLRSPYLTQGPAVPEFEHSVADTVGALHAVSVNSATSALHIACLALGLGPGDRLWTSPITFVASANCALYCGALVDFVDIDPLTGLMSVPALEAKLKQAESDGTLPKIVVPVHLTGSCCDMAAIGSLAKRYSFEVIEDASHAIGGLYKNRPVGNCSFSAVTVFSFHPVKIITTGEGGVATTNDHAIAQRMIELRSHGIVRDSARFKYPPAGSWVYEQQYLGFNYRMTDLQAALGLSQLRRLSSFVSERNSLFQRYRDLLVGLPFKLLDVPEEVVSSVHLAVIRIKAPFVSLHSQIFEGLRAAGIGVQLHYSPVHLQPFYRDMGFEKGSFPEAEAYANSSLSLPLFPGLQQSQQEFVVQQLISLIDD